MNQSRYHRQEILPQVGTAGQRRLSESAVVIVGCGALGSNVAMQLVRAGVGRVRLVDRDLVEMTNLQRQVLFDEADAVAATPKAVAAARHLSAINSQIQIEPLTIDIDSASANRLIESIDGQPVALLIDGSDNAELRYLLNDLAIAHRIPWIYGGVIGTQGRVMPILPGTGACLRCLYPTPPDPGELPTCDLAGVLGPAAAAVGAMQAAVAMRILIEGDSASGIGLIAFDLWQGQFQRIDITTARRDDCPCCGQRNFAFLNSPRAGGSASLCGRNAVQICPSDPSSRLDLAAVGARLMSIGKVKTDRFFVRFSPDGLAETLTIFPDGRIIVSGTKDPARARSLVARFIGV